MFSLPLMLTAKHHVGTMVHFLTLLSALALGLSGANAAFIKNNATDTCKEIEDKISKASDVVFPCKTPLPLSDKTLSHSC